MRTPVVLLVDDEDSILNSLRGSLEDEGYIVLSASDGLRAVDIVKTQPVDIVFLDIWLPGMDGMETLKAIKDFDSAIEVVMMTGHGNVNAAVQAVKRGAFDFLEKPFSLDLVFDSIRKIMERKNAPGADHADSGSRDERQADMLLAGEHPDIKAFQILLHRVVDERPHLLLCGEAGVGKEACARLMLRRADAAATLEFFKCNCALYDSDDLAAVLFGAKRKAGERSGKKGVLRDPSIGMVFLQNLDAVPRDLQARLADALTPGEKARTHPAWTVASVNRTRAALQQEELIDTALMGCFATVLPIPPLRERRGEVVRLLNECVRQGCVELGLREKQFDDEALELLVNYDWPGNIKELKNLVEKLVVSTPTTLISLQDIPLSIRDDHCETVARQYERFATLEEAENAWRRNYLLYHLRKHGKDVARTAAALKLREKNLRRYIKAYSIVLCPEPATRRAYQRTLKKSMVLSGRGLHSGDKTGLILTPMPPNSGIVFGNISSGGTVPASVDNVNSTDYATCLQNTSAVARTIEHLMATLHAYGITNLMIKINNEVPIMDGSANDFCGIIEDAGVVEQPELVDEIKVGEKLVVGTIDPTQKHLIVEPADTLSITYRLSYPRPVGVQEYTFVLDTVDAFKREIAPARTFGFLRDIEALNEKGLASGGRLNNFILIDDEKIINTSLRFPEEMARHKILDMLGDLYLLGRPVQARITANMTGHTENAQLVRLLRDKMHLTAFSAA